MTLPLIVRNLKKITTSFLKVVIPSLMLSTSAMATLPIPSVGAGTAGAAMGFAPSEILSALKFEMAKVWLYEVRFKVDGQVNNNTPVAVHVLFLDDEGLIKRLGEMSSDEYFRNSEQILSDYRSSLEVFSQTIIPGQNNDPLYIFPRSVLSKICVIFVDYSTPGAHRYNVGSDRIVELELGPLGFTVNTIKA